MIKDIQLLNTNDITDNSVIFYDKTKLKMEQVRRFPLKVKNVLCVPVGSFADSLVNILSEAEMNALGWYKTPGAHACPWCGGKTDIDEG